MCAREGEETCAPEQVGVDEKGTVAANGKTSASGGDGAEAVPSLRRWGETWLAARERAGYRGVRTDRSRWAVHVDRAPFADAPITSITQRQLRRWLASLAEAHDARPYPSRDGRKPLAAQTIRNTLNLLRCALEAAVEEEWIDANPALGLRVRLPRARTAPSRETWTVLTPVEQRRLLDVTPVPERWIVAAALGCGAREGELWSLRLADVHVERADPFVVLRYGGRAGAPRKNGNITRVPLFGIALHAFDAWLGALPRYAPKNPLGLVFPTRRGAQRDAKPPGGWRRWLDAAGIVRRVRWHDLRHTCATSLVGGWWGRRWSLEEVCSLLDHSSVEVTERYAHFLRDTALLERAANEADPGRCGAAPGVVKTRQGETNMNDETAQHVSAPSGGLEPPTFGLGSHRASTPALMARLGTARKRGNGGV